MKHWCRIANELCVVVFVMFIAFSIESSAGEVKIGQIHPMTGSLASIGQSAKRGHDFAVEKINASGGIKALGNSKIILLNGDTQGKPEIGMSESERLIRDGAIMLTGCYQSNVTFAATQVAERHQIPFVISMSIADNILERGFKYVFRTQYSSSMAANRTVEYIISLGKRKGREAKRIGLIYENTLFGKSTADALKKAAQDQGLVVVADISYPHKTTDLSSEVARLKAEAPDVVVPITYVTDGILLIRTMAEMKFDVLAVVGSANSGFTDPSFIKSLGALAEYTFNVVPRYNSANPEAVAVSKEFEKKYNVYFDLTSVYSYVATYVMADVLERAASTDPKRLLKALIETDIRDPKINILPQKGIKFGKVGKMENQNILANVVVEQILRGRLEPVHPAEYATHEPVWPVKKWVDR